jgi:CRP-like cAMP-binding protein
MPTTDTDSAIASFCGSSSQTTRETLKPRDWTNEDWKRLFQFTSSSIVPAGEALILRGQADRTLYFVLRGKLEVIASSGDRFSMGPLTRVGPGSVIGEQSFFAGYPRSASVWAVENSEVAAMSPDQYAAFAKNNPTLAQDLLFALGNILAIRLRNTTERLVG